ncbi:relaxase/mobilization nuclease domain-containing protein, partial [Porphyromonas gingivalis]
MVAEITAPKSMGKVLGYNFSKVTAGNASVILTSSMSVDQNGETNFERALSDMEMRIPSGIRTKKTVFHCSLNPHPDDRLTTEQLQDIAREYMEKMGYGKQPYIVFKHNDIAREHIHIVSLRVDSYGKKLPYKFEARRSK